MHIRSLDADDHPAILDLLVETFCDFFEGYVRPLLGDEIFEHQHGHWQQDYRDQIPALNAPESGRHAVVAELADGTLPGIVAWKLGDRQHHGDLSLLAVSPRHRRERIGHSLCDHAIAHMRAADVRVVGIATGGDPFHAPARALYEQLGFIHVPIAGYLGAI